MESSINPISGRDYWSDPLCGITRLFNPNLNSATDKKNNPESIKQKSANRLSQAQQQQNDGEGDSVGNEQQNISGQSDLFNVAPENTFKEQNPTAEEIQLRLEQNAG